MMSRDYGAYYANANFPMVLDDSLKLAIAFHRLEATDRKTEANNLREQWKRWALDRTSSDLTPVGLDALWKSIAAPKVDLTQLPWSSWLLQFSFRLRRPYLSKDERDFYIIDNPVRRERVFDVPYMAASSWKGCLRAALREGAPERALWLCGNEKGAEGDLRQGRLRPFPSFFNQVGLEIINPHDRPRRVGVKPLDFECAPVGARATFSLLYVPFDLAGCPADWRDPETGENLRQAIGADLKAVADAVQSVLTETGFGAKTSGGYGVAEALVFDFRWAVHAFVNQMPPEVKAPDRDFEAAITDFVQRFSLSDFPLWTNQELEQSSWGKSRIRQYKKLRGRHPDWDAQACAWREPASPPEPEVVPLEETTDRFDLTNLSNVASKLAAALQEEVPHE